MHSDAMTKRRHSLHLFPGRHTRPGSAPGNLTKHPAPDDEPVILNLIDFDDSSIEEYGDCTLEFARQYFSSPRVTWLHVHGTPSEHLLRAIGDAYSLHALALEDVLHTVQRSKLEHYASQLFTIAAAPEMSEEGLSISQLSLFLGDTWIVSFWSGKVDPFGSIRKRLKVEGSRLRKGGVDYLYYALIDTTVDLVFPHMEDLGERIEALEKTVFDNPTPGTLDEIHKLKRELLLLRRTLWPQRDMLMSLTRIEQSQIGSETAIYLRDCFDHAVHALDLVETYREMASSLLEVYLSSLSNRMNDVMKVLTIIATVFIPLSFLVGVYGMNFDRSAGPLSMPELGYEYSYPLLWLFMLIVVGLMLFYFRRKRWI